MTLSPPTGLGWAALSEVDPALWDAMVLADCVGSYFPEFQRVGLQMVSAQGGIFGWVADSAALLDSLAATPTRTPV